MSEPLPPLRLAAAPISWGVCEVPGWGAVPAPEIVLEEMRELGLRAAEVGPLGYLAGAGMLERYGLTAVGGFAALPLSQGVAAVRAEAELVCRALLGSEVLVLAAGTGQEGYGRSVRLSAGEWGALIESAAAVREIAAGYGLRTVLHPHVGTQIETAAEIERFLADSSLELCLDTGHVLAGGGDPLELVRRYPERIGHVHLKDVRADYAAEIRSGGWDYAEAVARGLYVPLGCGDVGIAAVVRELREAGYRGWYVLEQDVRLAEGAGPGGCTADMAAGIGYLEGVAAGQDREGVRAG